MGVGKDLVDEVQAVAWAKDVLARPGAEDRLDRVGNATRIVALWAQQLETACGGEVALSFVRAMHLEAMYAGIQIVLGLYKPAANAMRTMVESVLYFSYFRTHASELATLARDTTFYVEKSEILDFHKQHTHQFGATQSALNLLTDLNTWYSRMSAIAHGQLPGKWIAHTSIRAVKPDDTYELEAAVEFEFGARLVNYFFLCTVAQDSKVWDGVDVAVRREFLKGISGHAKKVLGLDTV